jgi:hypothetical protein
LLNEVVRRESDIGEGLLEIVGAETTRSGCTGECLIAEVWLQAEASRGGKGDAVGNADQSSEENEGN